MDQAPAVIVLDHVVEHRALRKARDDVGKLGPLAIFRRFGGTSDMHETGNAFVGRKAERVEYTAIIGVPFGNPAGCIA